MPTDYQFDDLDLRVDVSRGDTAVEFTMTQQTLGGTTCELTALCTNGCCGTTMC